MLAPQNIHWNMLCTLKVMCSKIFTFGLEICVRIHCWGGRNRKSTLGAWTGARKNRMMNRWRTSTIWASKACVQFSLDIDIRWYPIISSNTRICLPIPVELTIYWRERSLSQQTHFIDTDNWWLKSFHGKPSFITFDTQNECITMKRSQYPISPWLLLWTRARVHSHFFAING